MWAFTHGPLLPGGLSSAAPIAGTLAATEADDTLAATGLLPIVGTLAVTEDADTTTSAAALPIVGSLAATEAADTLDAAGSLGALASASVGTLAVTEADDTLAATGRLPITGTLAVTEDNDALLDESVPDELPPMPSDSVNFGYGRGGRKKARRVDPFEDIKVIVDPDEGPTEIVHVPKAELKATLPDINKILDEIDRVRQPIQPVVTIHPDDEQDMKDIMRLLEAIED